MFTVILFFSLANNYHRCYGVQAWPGPVPIAETFYWCDQGKSKTVISHLTGCLFAGRKLTHWWRVPIDREVTHWEGFYFLTENLLTVGSLLADRKFTYWQSLLTGRVYSLTGNLLPGREFTLWQETACWQEVYSLTWSLCSDRKFTLWQKVYPLTESLLSFQEVHLLAGNLLSADTCKCMSEK